MRVIFPFAESESRWAQISEIIAALRSRSSFLTLDVFSTDDSPRPTQISGGLAAKPDADATAFFGVHICA